LLAALSPILGFTRPAFDWHALAPEIILAATIAVLLVVDVFSDEKSKWTTSSIAGIGLLAALIPVLSMAVDGTDRVLFDGAYVVDNFALVLKGLFLVAGYITILLSTNYIADGDYWEGEYYLLVVSSVLGMTIMASSRDLITIFIALETLSIPAYLLAGFRKRDLKGNEAGLKYYLIGVFASGVMLYGMSLVYGASGSTVLTDIGRAVDGSFGDQPVVALGIVFTLVGFGFKVSAVPFQNWAPDTYEGAPTPITAFLSVASKAAGFVAILQLVFIGFFGRADVVGPMMWVLAALTMTVGNVIALRQTNIVRLFAYSSVAQAGFILAPLAVVSSTPGDLGVNKNILTAVIAYLLIYSIVNLGAFAVIIAVSRKTRSGEIASWAGLFEYAPALAVSMAMFLFALAGIPPLIGWFAKFQVFYALVTPGTTSGYVLAVVVGVNSVIALYYYANIARTMFMDAPPDGDRAPIKVPVPLVAAVTLSVIATVVVGFAPGIVGDLAEHATFALR
jgi:NADH-quinone oxidoreductase subunit N